MFGENKAWGSSLAVTNTIAAPFGSDASPPQSPRSPLTLNDEDGARRVSADVLMSVVRPQLQGPLSVVRCRGTGGQGRCMQVRDAVSGREIIVKQVSIENGLNSSRAQALAREAVFLDSLVHPHIIESYGVALDDTSATLGLQLEVMDCTLTEMLRRAGGALEERVIAIYLRQLLAALEYIHERHIVHLDVKPENLLVSVDGDIKLADFGLARVFPTAELHKKGFFREAYMGTFEYMAPEVVKPGEYGVGCWSDIWAVGCVAMEMATGRNPWGDGAVFTTLQKIVQPGYFPPVPPSCSDAFAAFVARCFNRQPQLRPTAAELLQDPFLAVE
eukprot:Opistho-2@3294